MGTDVSLFTKQVLAQYLFGQITSPTELIDSFLIRDESKSTDFTVSLQEHMQFGAGRFAKAAIANSQFLRDFFDATSAQHLELGDMFNYLSLNNLNRENYEVHSGGYGDSAFN